MEPLASPACTGLRRGSQWPKNLLLEHLGPVSPNLSSPQLRGPECRNISATNGRQHCFLPCRAEACARGTCPWTQPHTFFPSSAVAHGYSETLRLAGSVLFIIRKLPDCLRKLFRKHSPFIYSLDTSRGSFVEFLYGGSVSAGAVGPVDASVDTWSVSGD